MSLPAGHIIDGKYRVVRCIGTGGMGEVYEGENLRIKRRVAIKVLHTSVSSQSEAVARFEREAQAAGQIGSDHICEVLDLGTLSDSTRYMVLEYLEGETLGVRLKRNGRMAPLEAVPVMLQILDGLFAAHKAGIIHRDLKPDNVFLANKGNKVDFIKLLDFGVSKFCQLRNEDMDVTRVGVVVGTPYYMSPEQARGTSTIDARSDIYALGVLLYQITTGQVPFQAATFNELLFKIVLEPAPTPQHYVPDFDSDFSTIIQKAMAREPAHRFQDCGEFSDALLAWTAKQSHSGLTAVQPPELPKETSLAPSAVTSQPPTSSAGNTANAWGAGTTTGTFIERPRPVFGIVMGISALVGGALAALLVFGRSPSNSSASNATPSATSTVTTTSTSTAASSTTTNFTTSSTSSETSALSTSTTSSTYFTSTSTAPTTTSTKTTHTKTFTGTRTKTTTETKTNQNTGDFGY